MQKKSIKKIGNADISISDSAIALTKALRPARPPASIFLSIENAISSEAGRNIMPVGFRLATPEEVILRYQQDAKFRLMLQKKGFDMIMLKGPRFSVYNNIKEYGAKFLQRSEEMLLGNGEETVFIGNYNGMRKLIFGVSLVSSGEARIAYVIDTARPAA